MRRLQIFFNKILVLLRLRRKSRPEDIPKLLGEGVLQQAMIEAHNLSARHDVDVKDLAPGEHAGPPKPAGDFDLPPIKDSAQAWDNE